MRIALVTPAKLPYSCGNSLLAQRLQAGLALRGHEVALFGVHDDPVEKAHQFAPHIVHSLHAIKPALWLERLFQLTAPPWVITLTGTDYNCPQEYGAEAGMLERQFSKAAAIVAFHEEARARVLQDFCVAADKVHVIPQGIAVSGKSTDRAAVRGRYDIADDDLLFCMAAGIRPVKNIAFALKLFSAVRARFPQSRFILAGPVIDASEGARIREQGRAVEGFSYIGEIAAPAVRELMAASDIYVNVSLHEGMSGAVLEAMAEGLPVLASDAPGNRALVQHGITGFLTPCSAPDQFIAAAARLAGDRNLRNAMSRASALAALTFSVVREIDGYEKLYVDSLGSRCS